MSASAKSTPGTHQPSAARGVPLLDLSRQNRALSSQIAGVLARISDAGQFVLGPEVTLLEKRIAAYSQCPHAVGCASGSDALLVALMALGIGPGDEVILPSFTFFATCSAITRLGATPVFADIVPESFNIDPRHVARLVTPATRAIIPVHLFGQCAAMDALMEVSTHAKVPIVEDVAQAIGAEFAGRRAGSMGLVGAFSFYPTKNLGGAGDGGMLTTRDPAVADRLQLLRGHGMRPRYFHQVVGVNSRLDSFQAGVLNVKFPFLDEWVRLRQENANRYGALFADAGLDGVLGLPAAGRQCRHVWNQYVVRVPDGQRDELRAWLAEAQIGSEVYYPMGIHQQPCYRDAAFASVSLPETERAANEVLALPIFPELTAEEQEVVVARIAAFYQNRPRRAPVAAPKFLSVPGAARAGRASD